MKKMWNIGRTAVLIGNGVLMLFLAIALCSIGSFTSTSGLDNLGYKLAMFVTAFCLLITGASIGALANRVRGPKPVAIYLITGTLPIACWMTLCIFNSSLSGLSFLAMLGGLYGLLWSHWYLRLAFQFQADARKASLLCILAASSSVFGIILAMQTQLGTFGSEIAVGCFAVLMAVQTLLTAGYLYLNSEAGRETMTEPGSASTARV